MSLGLAVIADGKFRCPNCGGLDVRRSMRRGLLDSAMTMFHRCPFRCRACSHRFFASETEPEEIDEHALEEHADV